MCVGLTQYSPSVNGQTEAKIINTFYKEFNIINYKIKTYANSTKNIFLTMILNNSYLFRILYIYVICISYFSNNTFLCSKANSII